MEIPNETSAAVIGGGPAGLMAADTLLARGIAVTLYEAKPSVGRKLLMAGKSGLNLTFDEDTDCFLEKFAERRNTLRDAIQAFGPAEITAWAKGLGAEPFTGSTGRVFPKAMKASPLLRTWISWLRGIGLLIRASHTWQGWDSDGTLVFDTENGQIRRSHNAVVLALGGGSWPRLGSNGAWVSIIQAKGIKISPFRPSNCGFDFAWSNHFRTRFAGTPVKSCALTVDGRRLLGDFIISRTGMEGGAIYIHSTSLRRQIEAKGAATLLIDLAPGRYEERIAAKLSHAGHKQSLANRLRKAAGLGGVKMGLLRERLPALTFDKPDKLASAIKELGFTFTNSRPLNEAISTAGGLPFEVLNGSYMIDSLPGVFAAGEMLDWEAPTGGYLLTACLATGRAAGAGAAEWLCSINQEF